VSIIAKDLKINRSIYEILQILSASLLDKVENPVKLTTTFQFKLTTISGAN
jgi:hypothetical protein